MTNVEGEVQICTNAFRETWDDAWVQQSEEFENDCFHPSFQILRDKMFLVFNGNHWLYSWMELAEENSHDEKYHPRVVCQILKGDKSYFVQIESTMHALNRWVDLLFFFISNPL